MCEYMGVGVWACMSVGVNMCHFNSIEAASGLTE